MSRLALYGKNYSIAFWVTGLTSDHSDSGKGTWLTAYCGSWESEDGTASGGYKRNSRCGQEYNNTLLKRGKLELKFQIVVLQFKNSRVFPRFICYRQSWDSTSISCLLFLSSYCRSIILHNTNSESKFDIDINSEYKHFWKRRWPSKCLTYSVLL